MGKECEKFMSSVKGWMTTNLMLRINTKNAKWLAICMVLGFISFHAILNLKNNNDSCKWLLTDGRYKGDNEVWQPYGCMMHKYTFNETRKCFRHVASLGHYNHFVFIGDSKVRQKYEALVKQLDSSGKMYPTLLYSKVKNRLHARVQVFSDDQLRLKIEFIWCPRVDKLMIDNFNKWKASSQPPTVIVAGDALWTARDGIKSPQLFLQGYKNNITSIVKAIDYISKHNSKVLWGLQEPLDEARLSVSAKMLTNDQINLYNKAAIEALQHSKAKLWLSSRLVAEGLMNESMDGLHPGVTALEHITQILVNMYCNDHMNFNDGNCCRSAKSSNTLQIVTFAVLAVCFITALLIKFRLKYQNWKHSRQYSRIQNDDGEIIEPNNKTYELVTALAKLAVIMGYFYLCDRTNFFMKENKYFSQLDFWLPLGCIFALGLFFNRESKYTKVLHVDQTDELKGGMQLVILVYHLTGASKILPIYMHIRVMVSAYLFLSGYGHFCYFWHKGNGGLARFLQVLFRTNFLTVMLCLIMNQRYQFYYFVPLVSFWFLIIYLVFALPPHITAASAEHNPSHYFYLVVKLVGLFCVITILYMSEVLSKKVFLTRLWQALFVSTEGDVHEWWFRWKLDRYSMLYGCVFAFAFVLAQRFKIFDDSNRRNLFSPGITLLVTLGSLAGIGGYTTFSFVCRNKQESNNIHSYAVFIPIVSYTVLRNLFGVLRTRYSTLFAWFGRIALELFVCQCHAWLAADTHGVLILLPGYPLLNSLITSFVFVCASHELNSLTKTLTLYAVPNDWRRALRNVLLFLTVLVTINVSCFNHSLH